VSPVTLEGRLVAVVLMITGIGVIGIFTATVASLFFEQEAEADSSQIEARLAAVEAKLDRLLAQTEAVRGDSARAGRSADVD
jgi:voltage-gated potassium channel